MDSSGNLYGTTAGGAGGGANGDGTVFELAQGSSTITTLASFNGANGANSSGAFSVGLIMDSSGNLYGTTDLGGADDDGTVFELAQGSSTITSLASFNGTNGANPYDGPIMDGSRNLYGTTEKGGAFNDGTVFELAQGSSTITTLASFNGTNGAKPYSLIMDSSGNLYGTTLAGGPSNDGTVFEFAQGSSTVTTLASFNGTNPAYPLGLIMDSSGNLYGTTEDGGASYDGTVFELAQGSSTIRTLASFNGTNGNYPGASLIMDGSGNLYGTTDGYSTGAFGQGTVFELARGSSTITTLAAFNITDGAAPVTGFTMDSSGNLYGTTFFGGASDYGTIFELPDASAPIAPTVNTNPTNQTVIAGQTATFTAAASGSPTPTVQWQVSEDGGKTFNDIGGATSTTLTLSNVARSINGYEYRAAFTNSAATIDSSAATLTVITPTPAVITGNPTNQTVTEGQTATFTVSATGTPTPTVQWEFSPDGGKTWLDDGVTGATLVLKNVTASMNGYEFRAFVSNGVGDPLTSAATLTVIATSPPPPTPVWHNNLDEDVAQADQYGQLLLQAELNAGAFFYSYFYFSNESSPSVAELATEWSNLAEIYQAVVNYEAAEVFVLVDLLELSKGDT